MLFERQVIQAGPGDTALFSEASRCLNRQLGTQRMMGFRGKAVSRQAHPARVCVPLLEHLLDSIASGRVEHGHFL